MRAFSFALAILFALISAPIPVTGPAGAQSSEDLDARNRQVQQLYRAGKHTEALPIAEQYVAAARRRHGEEHTAYAEAISWLAVLLRATNRLAEAEPLMRRALAIEEKSLGPNHSNVALLLNNLALLLRDTKRLAEAEHLMRRVLSIDEKSSDTDPNIAIHLDNLALLLQDTNRLAEAEPLMRRALAIDEKSYGPDHPRIADRLNDLALLMQNTEQFTEAEALMRRALSIDEKSYGPEHPDVARDLNNLAVLLGATGRGAEAEALMRRAQAMRDALFWPPRAQSKTQMPIPAPASTSPAERVAQEDTFRRIADEFIAAAAAGDTARVAQMISPTVVAKNGHEAVERYLAGQVLPFFSHFKEMGRSETITPIANAPGFGFYMYMLSKTHELRPFVIYVIEEDGAKVVANILVDEFVEDRHCARVAEGWKCPDFR
jgi:tetratricopeptide (TPR) repeat protein